MTITPLNQWILEKHGFSPNDRDAVDAYHLSSLRALIEYAASRSPFYSQLYAKLPLPEKLSDFSNFPLISERDVIQSGTSMLCVSQKEISRIVTLRTSGTTDTPKRIFFTGEDILLTLDFFRRGMPTLCHAGDRALVLFPAHVPDSVGALLKTALEEIGLTVFLPDSGSVGELVHRENISVACGPPILLAKAAEESSGAAVRTVLSSSDLLKFEHRKALTYNWNCEIFDHFGMTETGLGGAVECRAHKGMHIRENDLYFETVSAGGTPLPDGEYGEIVVTTLTRRGMPLIRYRTGDLGYIDNQTCPCGSSLRRIIEIRRGSKI